MVVSNESKVEDLQSISVGKGIMERIDIAKRQNRMTFYFT